MSGRKSTHLFWYRLLTAVIFPLLAAHAAWLAFKNRDYRYLRQRLGFEGAPAAEIWIHAASVGEVNAAIPLIQVLAARRTVSRILVTTATVSGAMNLKTRLPQVAHHYLPLDRFGGMRRFLDGCRCHCALIVETELWPNLFAACAERKIPIAIVNGRISERTLRAPAWLRLLYREALHGVRAVFARTGEDRRRFIQLGAPAHLINVVGNLKFAAAPVAGMIEPLGLGRPYVLAASTREDEERLVVEAWERANISSHLLVIAPRHPRRLSAILADLAGRSVAVRSRNEAVTDTTAAYIADTLGELPRFIAGADLVFMGGSLVPKGGQNLLEPAALGKATVIGPHVENFLAEAEALLAEEGLVQVRDAVELGDRLRELLRDGARRRDLGANAKRVVDAHRGVAERYADEVERTCFSLP